MIECQEHRGETEAMASCPRCLIAYWESRYATLRARVEELEAFAQLVRDTADYALYEEARALLEKKP